MTSHHHHQSSLEGVIIFSVQPEPQESDRAISIFNQIIEYYEPTQSKEPYKRITLIRAIYEQIPSKDTFLEHFFLYIGRELRLEEPSQTLSNFVQFDSWEIERKNELGTHLIAFAGYFVDNFFLPLKASSRKTPQPTPAPLSEASNKQQLTGTTYRVSTLRRDCLIRDHHRCVISRKFDLNEALSRAKKDGINAKDDDGYWLRDEIEKPEFLEVAHILPHSLMSFSTSSGKTELSDSKKTALAILDMFDPGIVDLINGSLIDRPINALTLTVPLHQRFGDFEVYFEPPTNIDTQTQHIYKIDSIRSFNFLRVENLPITRTLLLTPNRIIDPPSRRLLTIHRACTFILYLSGAGDYINKILRDMDEVDIKEDGSTELGRLVGLKAGGWLDEVSVC